MEGTLRPLVILVVASLLAMAINNTAFEAREPSMVHIQNVDTFQVEPEDIEAIRTDVFKAGHLSVFDVLLHMDEQGRIDYEMQWYGEIAGSDVRTYIITSIDGHAAHARCGFVYEEGDKDDPFGNHIHIPSDIRVINSHEYEEWFWICL